MAETSKIEWTDTTWNPCVGCTKVSPGCAHCYAETMAKRLRAMAEADIAAGKDPGRKRHYLKVVDDRGRWNGHVEPVPEALADPLGWKKPRRVFVNSMSDLFHEDVPDDFIDRVFAVMALAPRHTFQVLTRRPERMASYLKTTGLHNRIELTADALRPGKGHPSFGGKHLLPDLPLPNVWLGVSVERQQEADERIPHLLRCPAAVRFLSCEPLLGALDLRHGESHPRVDWVITGCESGPKRRAYCVEWDRAIQRQCESAGVAFFRKQTIIGGRVSHDMGEWPADLRVRQMPAKGA